MRNLTIISLCGLLLFGATACKNDQVQTAPANITSSVSTSSVTLPHSSTQASSESSTEISTSEATSTTPSEISTEVPVSQDAAPAVSATQQLLNTLEVKGKAPKTGYSRDQFGEAWTDNVDVAGGHNGCDTRNDILQRDLTNKVMKNSCTVLSGTLNDPYTGTVIDFQRGKDTSRAVQIDHIVALSNAWQTGAQQLDVATRTALANDPDNLVAVDGPTNQQKSDYDAASWLPPNKDYRCTYVSHQIEIKARYHLWVTQPEKDAMERVLQTCS